MTDFELVRLRYEEVEASPGLAGWLQSEGCSLAFTTGSRLFLAGVGEDGSLRVSDCPYAGCSGLAAAGAGTVFLATRFQIWRLENALPAGSRSDEGDDLLLVPQAAWTTGFLGVDDLAAADDGRPVFVNSRFSCLATVSERWNFEPVWLPPFVSTLASEDRCHLSGVALDGGRPAYVTCAAATDVAGGWKSHRADGGVVVDVASGATVCTGLSLPQSPRLGAGRLWVVNGGAGQVGSVDPAGGAFEPVASLPGFARGVALHGRWAVVGCSRPARGETFAGLPLDEGLERSGTVPVCGVFVVDLDRGRVEHSLVLHGGAPEVYGVAVLPGTLSPGAVAVSGDEVQELVTIPCLA